MVKVAVLMGSESDKDKMAAASDTLASFGIEADVRVMSAPERRLRSLSSPQAHAKPAMSQ